MNPLSPFSINQQFHIPFDFTDVAPLNGKGGMRFGILYDRDPGTQTDILLTTGYYEGAFYLGDSGKEREELGAVRWSAPVISSQSKAGEYLLEVIQGVRLTGDPRVLPLKVSDEDAYPLTGLPLAPSTVGASSTKDPVQSPGVVSPGGAPLPSGAISILMRGSEDLAQELMSLGSFQNLLFSDHRGAKSPKYSTRILDIDKEEIDRERITDLSSLTRVEIGFDDCAGASLFWGVWKDRPSVSRGMFTSSGRFWDGIDPGEAVALGYAGDSGAGVLTCGAGAGDKHLIGFTDEGVPIVQSHLDLRAPAFFSKEKDGPFLVDPENAFPDYSAGSFWRAFLRYDGEISHPIAGNEFGGGFANGVFRVQVRIPLILPDPDGKEKDRPLPPPPPGGPKGPPGGPGGPVGKPVRPEGVPLPLPGGNAIPGPVSLPPNPDGILDPPEEPEEAPVPGAELIPRRSDEEGEEFIGGPVAVPPEKEEPSWFTPLEVTPRDRTPLQSSLEFGSRSFAFIPHHSQWRDSRYEREMSEDLELWVSQSPVSLRWDAVGAQDGQGWEESPCGGYRYPTQRLSGGGVWFCPPDRSVFEEETECQAPDSFLGLWDVSLFLGSPKSHLRPDLRSNGFLLSVLDGQSEPGEFLDVHRNTEGDESSRILRLTSSGVLESPGISPVSRYTRAENSSGGILTGGKAVRYIGGVGASGLPNLDKITVKTQLSPGVLVDSTDDGEECKILTEGIYDGSSISGIGSSSQYDPVYYDATGVLILASGSPVIGYVLDPSTGSVWIKA